MRKIASLKPSPCFWFKWLVGRKLVFSIVLIIRQTIILKTLIIKYLYFVNFGNLLKLAA